MAPGTSPVTASGALKYAAPSNQTGLFYVSLPKAFEAPGQALFAANCSSCHGPDALGTDRAPNLQGLGAATVDFWVSTGRMPLADSSIQATRKPPRFNRLQTLEIVAFVKSLTPGAGVQVPVVNTDHADLEAGNSLFVLNCAACHTITGAGDALADGFYAPSLHQATPTQIVEAIRTGPGTCPTSARATSPTPRPDIVSYVTGSSSTRPTPAASASAGSARWPRASSACWSVSGC